METQNTTSQALAPVQQHTSTLTAFSGVAGFEAAQRMARCLITSDLVPEQYRGQDKLGNALIALEMSQRIGASPLAVMQNLHIIHGRPSWSSSFIIAALNSCGRFSPIRFRVEGAGDAATCYAWAYDRATGEVLEGPPSSIAMAKAEGWMNKNGSKWKTMPDLMLRYRAAAFFGRLYAPDVLSGMHSSDEVEDTSERAAAPAAVASINERIAKPAAPAPKPAAAKVVEPAPAPEPEVVEPVVEAPAPKRAVDRLNAAVRKPKPAPAPEPEPEPAQPSHEEEAGNGDEWA